MPPLTMLQFNVFGAYAQSLVNIARLSNDFFTTCAQKYMVSYPHGGHLAPITYLFLI
jgi:hypothetical protein